MPKSRLTFSLVHPMGCRQSWVSWLRRVTFSSKGLTMPSPPAVMDSAPMAMPISMPPVAIWWAMSAVALSPDEQKRFTDNAPCVLGLLVALVVVCCLLVALLLSSLLLLL